MLDLKKISSRDAAFPPAWKVLTDAFPEDERRSLAAHERIEQDPRYEFCAITVDGRLAGVAAVWRFPRFMLLEHLAVAPGERSGGIGSGIVSQLLDRSPVPVVIEVEPTSAGADSLRRMVFYRTLGFIVNEYEYVQPAYDALKHPVPMLLLSYPEGMTAAQLDAVRDTLYREVYHVSL